MLFGEIACACEPLRRGSFAQPKEKGPATQGL